MTRTIELLLEQTELGRRAVLMRAGDVLALEAERPNQAPVVGNVYRGKVKRVLPSMQAAFINIGLEQPGFLHRRDISGSPQKIEGFLHEGQSILVQVTQAPRQHAANKKGATLSNKLSLATPSLVSRPLAGDTEIVASKQLSALDNKTEVLRLVQDTLSDRGWQGQFIVRRGAANRLQTIAAEIDWHLDHWCEVLTNQSAAPHQIMHRPTLLGAGLQALSKGQIDIDLTENHSSFYWHHVNEMFDTGTSIRIHDVGGDVNKAKQLQQAFAAASAREAALDNGGNLVIDHTAAMTVIDVNTGAATGEQTRAQQSKDIQHETNLLAAEEIARQLRLRNIGGITVVDFINVAGQPKRKQLLEKLNRHLDQDNAQTSVGANSKLGLVEITRERAGPNLMEMIGDSCSHCQGSGVVSRFGV